MRNACLGRYHHLIDTGKVHKLFHNFFMVNAKHVDQSVLEFSSLWDGETKKYSTTVIKVHNYNACYGAMLFEWETSGILDCSCLFWKSVEPWKPSLSRNLLSVIKYVTSPCEGDSLPRKIGGSSCWKIKEFIAQPIIRFIRSLVARHESSRLKW